MKKFFVFAAMATVCMLLTGCNDNPKKAVSDFAKALKNNDYQKASLCLENGNPQALAELSAKMPELQKSFISFKPLSANINGNEATVKTEMTVVVNLPVKKNNGVWQISNLEDVKR